MSLHEIVSRQALERPDATALVLNEERMSYAELDATSNRLARALIEAGCTRGDRIALALPKAPSTIAAMIATLKAGCAYVPIDVGSPAPRIAHVLRSAEPRVIFATPATAGLLAALVELGAIGEDVTIASFDEPVDVGRPTIDGPRVARLSSDGVPAAGHADDIAHLLFTSGSTGVPKGVAITHGNVLAFVEWAVAYFGIQPGDRVSGHPPLHFDLSTFDIYGSLLAGAELHLVPAALSAVPHRLADFIRRSELTQWFSVPTAMTHMAKLDTIREGDFPRLERVLWCGEVLPVPTLVHWMTRLPHATFTNLYGPTEATIASSYYTVPATPASETEPIPIGAPCAGESLHVLDGDLQPCPPGELGDVYIGGVGLSPGYWRDEERTAAAFRDVPLEGEPVRLYRTGDLGRVGDDGLVYYLGRSDSQVKSRGYRIELGEIEVAIDALGVLREAAVVGVELDALDGVSICCAYVPGNGEVDEKALVGRLRTSLPSYMIPSRWLALPGLPQNANGKIDRPRLRELFVESARVETAA
jgi:amino acid adenylation domain-containing protein